MNQRIIISRFIPFLHIFIRKYTQYRYTFYGKIGYD